MYLPLCPGNVNIGDFTVAMGGGWCPSRPVSRSSSEQYRSSPEEPCFWREKDKSEIQTDIIIHVCESILETRISIIERVG